MIGRVILWKRSPVLSNIGKFASLRRIGLFRTPALQGKAASNLLKQFSAPAMLPLWHHPRQQYSTIPNPLNKGSMEPVESPINTTTPPPKEGLTQKLKLFLKQYGKLGLGVYLGISLISFSSLYLAMSTGVDVPALIQKLGLPHSKLLDSAGTVAVAYAIHKVLMPVRIMITIALTSFIAKRTRFGGWMAGIKKSTGINNNGQHKR